MRAGRAVAGELEHPGAERGETPLADRDGGRRRVEVVEIGRGRGQRALVAAGFADHVEERTVADADAEEEPARERVRECGVTLRGLLRGVHPEVQDAGGHRDAVGRVEQGSAVVEDRPARAAREPDRRVAERLELGRSRGLLARVAVAQLPAPDSGATELHAVPSARLTIVSTTADDAPDAGPERARRDRHRRRERDRAGQRAGVRARGRRCRGRRSRRQPGRRRRRGGAPPLSTPSPRRRVARGLPVRSVSRATSVATRISSRCATVPSPSSAASTS